MTDIISNSFVKSTTYVLNATFLKNKNTNYLLYASTVLIDAGTISLTAKSMML